MNIQRVFESLEEDNSNSALGIICSELESQGYSIKVDGIPVSSEALFNGDHRDLEGKIGEFNLSLMKSEKLEQEFAIEFVDFHEFILKRIKR